MRNLMVIFALLLLPSLAFAEPLEFRGIKMGDTRADVYNKLLSSEENKYFSKREGEFCIEAGLCSATFYIKGAQAKVSFLFDDIQKLDAILFKFDPQKYETLRGALIEKYGDKFTSKEESIQNRMGAKFQNETLTWELPDGSVVISRYGNTIDKGSAMIMSSEHIKRYKEKKEKQKTMPGF